MKKIKILTSAILLSSMLCTSSVFAAEKKIPLHMDPGTVIQYDSNENMKVLKEGSIDNENLNTSNDYKKSKRNEKVNVPEIKPNMTVVYDALGAPIIVGGTSDANVISDSDDDYKSTLTRSNHEDQGEVSWYNIWGEDTASGSHSSDGAAHKTIAFYTTVKVFNEENGWENTKVRILDRGPYANGRILDMSKESFSEIANTNDGIFYGAIRW
ncbi:septal ring lytic transglycosylase RlpA family protein [Clostridium botulinum]|uniref:septal ring lytic transglycosylase RlpA family protein n=1 Tax=Clostridium sp. ZBS13 TaxID=2949971 RepID=UPI001E0BB528|nr:RlpA-like double-psi beta-barrel domain-containing protein [Clostridium sp. ZBS13]MBN1069329.1 septal ring lytic transglycosylase RlpA family protein [Clostridium botulinum]